MPDDDAVGPDGSTGLEAALAQAEREVDAAAKAVAALGRELKKARAAAASGQVRDLRKALDAARAQAVEVAGQVGAAAASYDVDEPELLSSGAYAKELLAAAEAAGVAMFEDDDRLLCYPSIVRVLPADLALEIDRRRARGIRPSVVVDQLGKAQRAGPRFKAAPFLASLQGAYDLVVAGQGKSPGAVVRLVEVYAALTLLPGQSREYTKAEFARDLYLLDQSGAGGSGADGSGAGGSGAGGSGAGGSGAGGSGADGSGADGSGAGRRLRWAASSGTRGAGVLTTVTRNGQQQRYWGIAFERASA